jgi:hypothetical protein
MGRVDAAVLRGQGALGTLLAVIPSMQRLAANYAAQAEHLAAQLPLPPPPPQQQQQEQQQQQQQQPVGGAPAAQLAEVLHRPWVAGPLG